MTTLNKTATQLMMEELDLAIAQAQTSQVAQPNHDIFDEILEAKASELSKAHKIILKKGFSFLKGATILKGMIAADGGNVTSTMAQRLGEVLVRLRRSFRGIDQETQTNKGQVLVTISKAHFPNMAPAMVEASNWVRAQGFDKGQDFSGTNCATLGATEIRATEYGFRITVPRNTYVAGKPTGKNLHMTLTENHLSLGNPLPIIAKSIIVHNVVKHQDDFGNVATTYGDVVKIKNIELLPLMLASKDAGIDINNILVNQGAKIAVLGLAESRKTFKLSTIECPQIVMPTYYSNKTSGKLSEAAKGILIEPVCVPNLIEYIETTNGNRGMVTLESANKTISRDDKLNHTKVLFTTSIPTFVVVSTKGLSKAVNSALNGGNVIASNSVALDLGDCRLVSDTSNGGNKAALLPVGKNSCSAKGDYIITSAASLKGGVIGVHSMINGLITPNLKDLYKNKVSLLTMFKEVLGKAETITFNSETVEGVWVNIDYKVTNSGTLDSYVSITEEDEGLTDIELARKTADRIVDQINDEYVDEGVRASYINARQNTGVGVAEWIKSELKAKNIKLKETKTRIGVHELEAIREWYGKEKAKEVADLLIEGLDDSNKASKDVAMQFLGLKTKDVSTTVSVEDIRDAIDHNIILNNSVTADQALALVALLKGKEGQLIEIVGDDGESTYIPAGYVLVADMEKEAKKLGATYVPMKGLVKDIILSINDSELPGSTVENIQANTQATLLGKNLGYLEVKGWYGNILPFVGGHKNTVGMTRRNDIVKSSETMVQVTMGKNPLYFKWMLANYNAVNITLGNSDLDDVFRRALFVNTTLTLTFQNDFDGDQMRVTSDLGLELAGDLTAEFNGTWFNNFVVGEMEGNSLKAKEVHFNSLKEYNQEIFKAVNAKKSIGSLTANSYMFAIALANLVGVKFELVSNPTVKTTVTKADTAKMVAILNMLVQTESMDNIKQSGANEMYSDNLMFWFMQNSKNAGITVSKAYESLAKARNEYELDLTDEEIMLFAEAFYAAANHTKSSDMIEYSIFNNRNVKEKRFNVMEFGAKVGESSHVYENIGNKAIKASKDKASMYAYLIQAFTAI